MHRVRVRPLLVLAWLALVTADAGHARSLDLDDAIELALEQNRSLVIDALDVRAARTGVARAEAEFDVRLRPVLEFGTLDDNETLIVGVETSKRFRTGTEVSVDLVSEDFDTELGRRARLAVEFNQPLFRRFGRLVNEEPIKRATSALRRAERLYHAERANLVLDVIESYEDIQRLERQVEADDTSLERADELLRSTTAKESLGRTTRIDVLRVELQKGLAASRLAADRERLEAERQAFAELLGLDPDSPVELAGSVMFEVSLPTPAAAVGRALENRLDYAQAIADRDDAERGALIAENLVLPDVRVSGRYERADRALAFADGDRSRWFLGVSGDTDLNTRAARLDIERAQLQAASAAQRIRVVELGIAREVRQAMLAYRRSRADLKTLDANLENARARLELARRLFEAGRADNFSVTDAEEAFLDAQRDRLSGRASASLAGYDLLHALGVLVDVPAALKPGGEAR